MHLPRSLSVLLCVALLAPVAVRAATPSPFGPEVKTLALRVVDAPDAFGVKPEGVDIGGLFAGWFFFGIALGVAAKASSDNAAEQQFRGEALELLTKNAPAIERFEFRTRIVADLRREIERNGWVLIAGEPTLIALADPAAKPVPYEAARLAQSPEELLASSGTDAVLVIRPRLSLEERARYLRLQFDLDVYSRHPDGRVRHVYTHDHRGSVSRAIDGMRTPPKTERGQTADFGSRWLADDAARLRAEYEQLAAREITSVLSRLRESLNWYEEQ